VGNTIMNVIEEKIILNDTPITLQTGKLAPTADVAIYAKMGDTCVLVTVVSGPPKPDADYFPLNVEYAEKLYAGGRIKGSRWVKREGRPTDESVLIGRLIDRSIRPLFPKNYRNQVQVVITLLSVDGINSPEIIASIATSAAITASQIPWAGPISTIRVGYVNSQEGMPGGPVINPSEQVQDYSALDLVVSSTSQKVLMIETKAEQLSESIVAECIAKAHETNQTLIEFINRFAKKIAKPKTVPKEDGVSKAIDTLLKSKYKKELDALSDIKGGKEEDREAINDLVETVYTQSDDKTYDRKKIAESIKTYLFDKLRSNVLEHGKRFDGRGIDEIRDIFVETSILPRTHGSSIFQRGQTQVMSVATLGAPTLAQLIESAEGETAKRYIHHYYMPPYSVGEVGRVGFTSRREIGHGALAEKALEPVLPTQDEFPYAIRIVSEVLSSNGSTSMASACASSLSLMDAGVPIKAAVAGISVGLVYESNEKYVLLTDIAGIEDFAGHMDFKVAGTTEGITAIQLDVKNDGITMKMIEETLEKAKVARMFILEKMNAIIQKPRMELSKYAPKVVLLTPPADKIGEIIGPGGKNIKHIIAVTGCDVDISDDGKVSVTGIDREAVEKAVELINNVYRVIQPGEKFDGEVKRMLAFGAFVEILPGKDGMIHVSKMGKGFVKDPGDVLSIGQKVKVQVIQIDQMGRINLQLLGDDGEISESQNEPTSHN